MNDGQSDLPDFYGSIGLIGLLNRSNSRYHKQNPADFRPPGQFHFIVDQQRVVLFSEEYWPGSFPKALIRRRPNTSAWCDPMTDLCVRRKFA